MKKAITRRREEVDRAHGQARNVSSGLSFPDSCGLFLGGFPFLVLVLLSTESTQRLSI